MSANLLGQLSIALQTLVESQEWDHDDKLEVLVIDTPSGKTIMIENQTKLVPEYELS